MENEKTMENRIYDPEDREIDLIDLFFNIMGKWRQMLILGLVLAVIAGIYGAVKTKSTFAPGEAHDVVVSEYEAEVREYERQIDAYDKLLSNLEAMEQALARREEYRSKSIYLNLDLDNVVRYTTTWVINLGEDEWDNYHEGMEDPVDQIVADYAAPSTIAKMDWDRVAAAIGESPDYISEVVSVAGSLEGNSVVLTVTYKDKAGAEKLKDEVKKQLLAIWSGYAAHLPGHSVEEVMETIRVSPDKRVADDIKAFEDELVSYKTQISNIKSQISNAKKPWELDKPKTESVEDLFTEKVLIKKTIKYAVIGFVAGVFLIFMFYGVLYLMSGLLRTREEFRDYYGIEVISDIPDLKEAEKKNSIDKLLVKLRGRKIFSREEYRNRTMIRLEKLLRNKKLVVTGTAAKEKISEIAAEIKEAIPDMEITEAGNITEHSEGLRLMDKETDILLIEKKNSSKHKDIEEEIRLIRKQGGRIIGGVIL